MSKGKYHDRQDIGYITKPGYYLQLRQLPSSFNGDLTLRLLGDDAKKERSYKIGSEWVSVYCEERLVPFIDTPYGENSAILQWQMREEGLIALPVYEYEGDQAAFIQEWKDNNADYALIKGKYFQLLAPKIDIPKIQALESIDSLIDDYNKIFTLYNNIAGFDESTPINRNSANRYFLKADVSGAGGAYYGQNYTANSENTINMWLQDGWGRLHEIAHGYQAGFDNQGMYTREVSNNLFGVQYQYGKFGREADNVGWLFNYGKKQQVDDGLYNDVYTKNLKYADLDNRAKLLVLTMLKQRAGDVAHTKLYQGYRKDANTAGFNNNHYNLPDLLNDYYGNYSKLDFTPALQRWGLSLENNRISLLHRMRGYPAVASLTDIFVRERLQRARMFTDPKWLISCNFQMVTNKEIMPINVFGTLRITFDVDDIEAIKGTEAILRDGNKIVRRSIINNNKLQFNAVYNGVYSLTLQGSAMRNYEQQSYYVYVKNVLNDVTIRLEHLKYSHLVNQSFKLLGLSDTPFGTIKTDMNRQQINFSITNKDPHSRFNGEDYVTLTLTNSSGMQKYTKTVEGTGNTLFNDAIPFVTGDILTIYHAETKNRLVSKDNIVDRQSNTNTFTITDLGLRNASLNNDPKQLLIDKLVALGDELESSEELKGIPFDQFIDKKNLWLAISALDEENKAKYMEQYKDLLI